MLYTLNAIMQRILLCCLIILLNNAEAKQDVNMIEFVKSFVENENKPTFLISMTKCWDKCIQVALQKELSKINIRFSLDFSNNIYNNHQVLFLTDLNCPNALENLTASTHLRSPYRWLVLTSNEAGLENTLEGLPLLLDSEFVLAQRNGDIYTMTEIYKATPNGSLILTPRGYFNKVFIDIRPHREIYRRRKDIRGHPLTMSNVIQDSNTTMYHMPREDRLKPHLDVITKIAWSNAKLGFEMLNATPRYVFSYRWGYKQNGTWSGMIDDIYSGRADMGTNCVANTERLPVVVYTDSIAPFGVKFVFRQPPLPYVANIFSLPFSTTVWVALIICVIFSSFTIYLASRWEVRNGEYQQTQLDGTFGDALLLTLSALSQQGCAIEPRRVPGRIMLFVVFTALMALYAAYSANIVVLLQAPSNAIQTLEQLANSKMTIAAYEADYNHFVFQLYKDPVRVLIHKRIEPEKGKAQFYEFNEGVERIRKGLFAFHTMLEPVYRRVEETFLEQEKCDLMEIDYLRSFDPLVPVKKDSPYLELLRVVFKQIREFGIRSALFRRMQIPKPKCSDNLSAFSSVGLNEVRPVLVFILYGFALSIFILCLEMLYFIKHQRFQRLNSILKTTRGRSRNRKLRGGQNSLSAHT